MPYKLTYFPVRGLGEMIRYLLIDNDIAFEDDQFDSAKWPEIKPTMTFGQVPCLFDGDLQICQSGAIMRHLGRQHGLYGSSPADAALADQAYEAVKDLHSKYTAMIYTNYDGKADFIGKVLPGQLEALEKLLKSRGGKGFILGGEKLCFADYALLEDLRVMTTSSGGKCLEAFPVLNAYLDRFLARPKIAAYIATEKHIKMKINGNDNV